MLVVGVEAAVDIVGVRLGGCGDDGDADCWGGGGGVCGEWGA